MKLGDFPKVEAWRGEFGGRLSHAVRTSLSSALCFAASHALRVAVRTAAAALELLSLAAAAAALSNSPRTLRTPQ